jgi:hypothetical protein
MGRPFLVVADTAWSLFTELTHSQVREFFRDRRSRGVNALRVQVSSPVKFDAAQNAPAAVGAGGALPFTTAAAGGAWNGTGSADFATPNNTYWNWVDVVFREAATYGIVLIADYAYMGFDNGAEGWWGHFSAGANTQSVCEGFGTYLGNRWKNHENLIIGMGTDMFPTSASESSARFLKILDGLQAAGCSQLVVAQYGASSDGRDYSDYNSRVTLNGVYPQLGGTTYPTHGRCRRAYNRSPAMPALMLEPDYEGTGDAEGVERRENIWWSFLSTNCGVVVGNSTLWKLLSGWESLLGTPGIVELGIWANFTRAIPWSELVPRGLGGISDFVTANGGSAQTLGSVGTADNDEGNDWVAAAVTPSGTHMVAYRPDAHKSVLVTFTIDMSVMGGTSFGTWINPATGAEQSAGSGFANSSTRTFTPPADHAAGGDWVLWLRTS